MNPVLCVVRCLLLGAAMARTAKHNPRAASKKQQQPISTCFASTAVVAKRQNDWVGNDVGCTSLVETFHFRKQFSASQPCGAGC